MNRELRRRVRKIEGERADQPNKPRIMPFPPRTDGRDWTVEEEAAAHNWDMTCEEWEVIFCSGMSHEEVEDRITRELHRQMAGL